MKLRIFGLVLILIFCFGVVSIYAEEPKNQIYFCLDVLVKPSKVADYEANQKKLVAEYTKHNYKYPWMGFSSTDLHYFYAIPISNHAEIDTFAERGQEMIDKMGKENFDKLWNGFGGTYVYTRDYILIHRQDLSYMPTTPRVKPEDAKFFIWRSYIDKSDMLQEAESIMKDIVTLFKNKNITNGFNVFQGGIGTDSPMFMYESWGLGPGDLYTNMEKDGPLLGEEFNALVDRAGKAVEKYEETHGFFRPDLSYTPKTESAK